MCVPGAIAATSAAIVIRKPADAAREPDGPTNTTTGVFAAKNRRIDVPGRVDEPAGSPERDDDQRRTRRIGLSDRSTAGIPRKQDG